MKLTAIQYGKTFITGDMAFLGGNPNERIPIALLFFLIETENKKILFDAGCDTMPGFELSDFRCPADVLEECGVNREDITHVILTHSHHDHVDGIRHYPKADLYIHESELEKLKLYVSGKNTTFSFLDSFSVTENIEIKHIGGHSEGSSIVIVEHNDSKYVLCGDECYTCENLLNKIPTGSSFCSEKSKHFIEEYSKKCYNTILFHDPNIVGCSGCKTIFK